MDEVESLTLPAAAEYRLATPHQPPWRRYLNKVRRSFWQTSPQGEAFGLRCRYGSWSPVGTVQDRSSLSLRSVMDACHRHASPEMAVENGAGRVPPARSALCLPLEGRGGTDSCGNLLDEVESSPLTPRRRIFKKNRYRPSWIYRFFFFLHAFVFLWPGLFCHSKAFRLSGLTSGKKADIL